MIRASTTSGIVAFFASVLFAGPVVAQDELTDRLLDCDAVSDLTQRLVCFNDIVDEIKKGRDEPAATSPEADPGIPTPAAAIAPAPAAVVVTDEPAPDPQPVEPAPAVAAAPEPEPATPPATAAAPVVAATTTTAAVEAPVAADERSPVDDQEEARRPPGTIRATIVQSSLNYNERFTVVLDNGQVWQETQRTRRFGRPKVGRVVEITEGRLGAYEMRVEGTVRSAYVTRRE